MKANKPDVSDLELFHQATRLVKPMPVLNYISHVPNKKQADPELLAKRLNAEGTGQETYLEVGTTLNSNFYSEETNEFVQTGSGNDLIRKLKKGKWPVQANLDLHGFTLESAQINLERFIVTCLDNNLRCVRIIHGKGIGSASGKSVLKIAIRHHLSRLKAVQAWVQCKERDGGAGAVIVLIRQNK